MTIIHTKFSASLIQSSVAHLQALLSQINSTITAQKGRSHIYCIAPSHFAALQLHQAVQQQLIVTQGNLEAPTNCSASAMETSYGCKIMLPHASLSIITSSELTQIKAFYNLFGISKQYRGAASFLPEQEEKTLIYTIIDNILHTYYAEQLAKTPKPLSLHSPWAQQKISQLSSLEHQELSSDSIQGQLNELRRIMWVAVYDFYNLNLDLQEIYDLAESNIHFNLLTQILSKLEAELKKRNKQLIAMFWRNLAQELQKNPNTPLQDAAFFTNDTASPPTNKTKHTNLTEHYVIIMPQQASCNLQTVWQSMANLANCSLFVQGEPQLTPLEPELTNNFYMANSGRSAYDCHYAYKQFLQKIRVKWPQSNHCTAYKADSAQKKLILNSHEQFEQALLSIFTPSTPLNPPKIDFAAQCKSLDHKASHCNKESILPHLNLRSWHSTHDEIEACLTYIAANASATKRIIIAVSNHKLAVTLYQKLTFLQQHSPLFAALNVHNFFKLSYLRDNMVEFFLAISGILSQTKLKIHEIMGILQHHNSIFAHKYALHLDNLWCAILQRYPSLRYSAESDLLRLLLDLSQEKGEEYAEISSIFTSIYDIRALYLKASYASPENHLQYCFELHRRLHSLLLFGAIPASSSDSPPSYSQDHTATHDANNSVFTDFIAFLEVAITYYTNNKLANQSNTPYLTMLQNFANMSCGTNPDANPDHATPESIITDETAGGTCTISIIELADAKYAECDHYYILGATDECLSDDIANSKSLIQQSIQNKIIKIHNYDDKLLNSIFICDIITIMLRSSEQDVTFTWSQYDELGAINEASRWLMIGAAYLNVSIVKGNNIPPYRPAQASPVLDDSSNSQHREELIQHKSHGVHVPPEQRPHEFTVSSLQNLLTNPFYYFYRHILNLKPFFSEFFYIDLNKEIYRIFGLATHRGLARAQSLLTSAALLNATDPDHERVQYLAIIQECLGEMQAALAHQCEALAPALYCLWQFRWENILEYLINTHKKHYCDTSVAINEDNPHDYPPNIALANLDLIITTEIKGELQLSIQHNALKTNNIRINGIFDRIDQFYISKQQQTRIIEYKTGQLPSAIAISNGEAIQMPLLAYIFARGKIAMPRQQEMALERIAELSGVTEYLYYRLDGRTDHNSEKIVKIELHQVEKNLNRVIRVFFHEATPYINSNDWPDTRFLQLSREKDFW